MNKLTLSAIAATISITFSAGAMADNITKSNFEAGKARIAADYKSATAGCKNLAANANDVCIAEAKGAESVATAELDASYKPSLSSHYNVVVTKADATYSVAKEKCDAQAGNANDVCLKEAKAANIAALADAKVQMKTTAANKAANEESSEARVTAQEKKADARTDAATDKRDANYAVAKEKCDVFTGGAKESCINDAKTHYGM